VQQIAPAVGNNCFAVGVHALRVFWSKVTLERLSAPPQGSLRTACSVSRGGYQRLRELPKA
jgi:hypothetical protein